jgi:hypothetical protein
MLKVILLNEFLNQLLANFFLLGRCDWLDNVDCTRRDSEGNKKEPKEEEEEEREETTKRSKTKKPAKTTPPVDDQAPEVISNFESDFDDEKKSELKREVFLNSQFKLFI